MNVIRIAGPRICMSVLKGMCQIGVIDQIIHGCIIQSDFIIQIVCHLVQGLFVIGDSTLGTEIIQKIKSAYGYGYKRKHRNTDIGKRQLVFQ